MMAEAEVACRRRCLKRQGAIDAILEKNGNANGPVLEIPDPCDANIPNRKWGYKLMQLRARLRACDSNTDNAKQNECEN